MCVCVCVKKRMYVYMYARLKLKTLHTKLCIVICISGVLCFTLYLCLEQIIEHLCNALCA